MKRFLAMAMAACLLLSSMGCGSRAASENEAAWGRADAKEIDVNSKIPGRVVELLVKEGDTVQAGQVIARIDKRDLEAKKEQYEANIAAIEAQQQQAAATTTMQTGTTQSALGAAQRATSERGDATDIVSFNVKIQVNDPRLRPGMRMRLAGDDA